ncbi:integrator complex subunit 1 [Colias croceus]|uniref:integrator complex subunit 1 n=1 Tax=Colias crocea TaxID=72248 RepID=UPI001E27F09A|nr:integrator complex subunit 1 [Colias croceus]
MERGKMSSAGRGGKSKAPQHPQDIFALGSKSTVVVSRDSEKRNIHKPSTSGVAERKREGSGFGSQPPNKRSRIGSPAEAVAPTSLEIDPVDLVPNVLQALDTHNSDKLLGLLTGSIRLLKSQRSKPDLILCMSMLYLTKIRPNMFAHETVTQTLCTLLKREQGAAFKSKGNPLVFVLACNMLYAGHKDSNNWPDTFIKVYLDDALNERWWVDCSWCKCLVDNIVTAFSTKQPPPHLIPSDNTLGTMSPSGSGSPLMGSTEDDVDNAELDYSVFPRYSSSYETVEALVLEAIKEQIQRRAAPDAMGKGFLKLLSATCGFPEIRMIAASRLEGWLHSGKTWRAAQELLAYVCANACAAGPSAPRDHEVLAQLARMRLKTKPLQSAYQSCLREMVSESPALLRSVVTHTIYNELSNVRSPNNMAVLAALIHAQPQLVPTAMADTYLELLLRTEDYLRPLRALTRECIRAARSDAQALLPLARALAQPPPHDPPQEIRERAFLAIADLFCCCCLVTAAQRAHCGEYRAHLAALQQQALAWLLDTAVSVYRPQRHDYQHALNKIMFVEPAETYSKVDNWPAESERALTYRLCCEAPLSQNTLLRLIFIGLSKEIPVSPAEVFELIEQLVRRACALPPEDSPLQVDKLEIADYIFQLCQFHPPDNITLPAGYTAPSLAITSLYWRGWLVLTMLAAHNPHQFAERAATAYPTLRALIECCITGKPSIEWVSGTAETERVEAERAAILQLETHLAAASAPGKTPQPITDHSSRLLAQLTLLEPSGAARRPPAGVAEALQTLSSQLRLGRLLCRQPALLLQLVERHGTRRAMPWLHQLLKHDRLELSVLPVQCLCEFLSAGGAGGAGAGETSKAGELCAHVRRTLQTEEGARAVLHYYMHRLAHAHAPTRASATRGLKLVLSTSDDATELDYNSDVNPESWLPLLPTLRHWDALRGEALRRVRAALLVECEPTHLSAYLSFLAEHCAPDELTDTVLDLSQVLMERTTVMAHVLPAERAERCAARHRALHSATTILYTHLRQVLSMGEQPEPPEPMDDSEEGASTWSGGEKVTLQWTNGRRATLHVVIAHAHLKLLCYGPSMYDTNQEMYTWLQSMWVGADAPETLIGESPEEGVLLPDWLRLHLVRSARPALLEAGLRGLPAHKLALFIQTFGMPVASMSALLAALDACPVSAVVRLGVERGYMAQLLRVQRARGATGGAAFAAVLKLQRAHAPPDDTLFVEPALPEEACEAWDCAPEPPRSTSHAALLATAFAGANSYSGDLDTGFTQLNTQILEESRTTAGPATSTALDFLRGVAAASCAGSDPLCGVLARPHYAAPLVRSLLHAAPRGLPEICNALLARMSYVRGPVYDALRAGANLSATSVSASVSVSVSAISLPNLPPCATKEQIIAAFESATSSTLEAIGNYIIETQDTQLVVDAISQLLQNNQDGKYDLIKEEPGKLIGPASVLSGSTLGCGLLLDWLAELHRETLCKLMRVMFVSGGARWRPLLVTLVAQRASWRTLHACLAHLLTPDGKWAARAVLEFAETLVNSPRIWQGRDRATPKHYTPDDTLRLTHKQLDVLIRYVGEEAWEVQQTEGMEGARRRIEARLPLVLRCCGAPHALLAAALAASHTHPLLLLLLYMKVPKVLQVLRESSSRPSAQELKVGGEDLRLAARASTSATDQVSHALLTALAHHAPHAHGKDHSQKAWRIEAAARAVWARVEGAGERALPLAGALLRGVRARHHHHLLAALEMLPDRELFAAPASAEIHGILECFLTLVTAGEARGAAGALPHRVAALLRRYLAARPARAAALLHKHRDVASHPALSSVVSGEASASASPPPHALAALQRRRAPPDELTWLVQEVEAWGVRRGGAWGGARAAGALARAVAPLAAHAHAPLRNAALSLLTKLLPAVPDTQPGLQAILECLESPNMEVVLSVLDRLPSLVVGLQEHGAVLLSRLFELGVHSRAPVDTCLAKCVAAINLQRAC